ncbi:AMP-binding enzyme family protein (macronuclear) [Tetrahymena thermophila SB210]|uniref:AMP-binding enzyme family protein n=1 Tax=Tetrahymena thermophila (strain SB210) TaxID=312017 RepID=Q22PA5_TETTS|nr:AMP-binding enzyme family protein [Tetrahymena thermophila SB210]EAR87204.2 AMP-binding enzyme family protein [Tetrahymena thermophila SB210]|eukprot:XP_001007449.2 AMP-binding enzyme family protein [Tetrahymena thermophila SB210]
MNYSRLDLFSTPFSFNFGNQVKRKGTIYGAILSLSILTVFLVYSLYLFYLYASNQINPTYAWQSFVTEETIQVDLNEDLVGFRYEYGVNLNLDDLQAQQNKTYLVFLPYFFYQNGTEFQMIPLNYTKCTSPKLKGFNCFDFSTIKNYTLILNSIENLYSQLYIFIYKCQDTDQLKTFIPNNCVDNDDDYNSVIYNPYADFLIKLQTSQYNTSSQQAQVNYRNSFVYMVGNSFQYYSYKIQKQTTFIKSGAIIQTERSFSSPIQYEISNINEDRQTFIQNTQEMQYMQISIQMDEIIQQIQIQYLNLPQILAQCNSTLALLVCIGILGRKIAESFMRQDIFLLLLQNMFHGTYESILKKNHFIEEQENFDNQNLIQKNEIKEDQKEANENVEEDEKTSNNNEGIFVPSFKTKSINLVYDQHQQLQNQELLTNQNDNQQDFILEQEFTKKIEENNNNFPLKKRTTGEVQLNSRNLEKSYSQYQFKKIQINQPINLNDQDVNFKKISEETNSSIVLGQTYYLRRLLSEKYQKQPQKDNSLQVKNTIKKIKAMKDNSILNGIRQKVFKIKIFKQCEYQKSQGLDAEDKRIIDQYINESLDILQIYRDLIFLKKAVLLLFSKEQLAMLQLIGISSNFCKQQVNSDKNLQAQDQVKPKEMSYFEEQISILKDSHKSEKYIISFFDKLKLNKDQTEVDQRILNSLQ